MNLKEQTFLNGYKKLRDEVDQQCTKLEQEHANHIKCKSGCDFCCMNYNIFPIEFYSILTDLKHKQFNPAKISDSKYNEQDCIFLFNHRCTIYDVRPIICRTHGLPLLYLNDDDEWELSTCELNFQNYNFELFTNKNTFAQDTFNSKLFQLNRDYIKTIPEQGFTETDLISLKELTTNLE